MSKDAYYRKRRTAFEFDGETFYVLPIRGTQFRKWQQELGEESSDGVLAMSFVCCACACDADGTRTFSDDDIEEILEHIGLPLLKASSDAAMKASGIGDDEPGKV
jgi:hypothetical protein